MRLVGDIGGTKALLALTDDADSSAPTLTHIAHYACADYNDFAALLRHYLSTEKIDGTTLTSTCLAVAGPIAIDGQSAQLTNINWHIDTAELTAAFKLAQPILVNDFAAAAMGTVVTTTSPLHTLQAGVPVDKGVRLVLGAGTGLGVASLSYQAHNHWHVLPGEGGHIGFAPQDEQQDALCRWLRRHHTRVIIEHIVSGIGLANIHAFLCGKDQATTRPEAITDAARQGDAQARASFDLFASIYGAVAGDFALARLSRGGVFLAGGIAARNIDLLQRSPFVSTFNAKGVHSEWVKNIPIHIVTEPYLALHGAAQLCRA